MKSDVIIIGAGVLGISLAYHLAKRGKRVIVLERESSFGQHASSRNAGMIRQLYRHHKLTEWAKRSINDWPTHIAKAAFKQTGSYIVGRETPEHHKSLFETRAVKINTENGEREIPAVYSKGDGLLDPGDYLQLLIKATDKTTVKYYYNCGVQSLEKVNDNWEVFTRNGVVLRSEVVVNAAGAWLNRFLEPYCPWLAVKAGAFARHLFVVTGFKSGFMPESDCGFYWSEYQDWYLRNWDKFDRLVSICDQTAANPDVFVARTNVSEVLAERLSIALPEQAKSLSLKKSWHCFRTYADDQLPIFGEDCETSGLFWLGAFGGFGMSTSFGATADAADYICGKKVSDVQDFSPGRTRAPVLGSQIAIG
jgi:glycine/D-amino acid oxidase-like deaminating enzyme